MGNLKSRERISNAVLSSLNILINNKLNIRNRKHPVLERIREFVEAGYMKPVLDRCYPLEDMAEAHRYVETGHKKGGVAVSVRPVI
jgi:NADPH:quinone reductase-like Zn-dependent oxidoreductase